MKIRKIWHGPALLGEGPMWHGQEQKLYWIDILGKKVYCWDPDTQKVTDWTMPDTIGCIAPRAKGGLVAALANEIAFINTTDGDVTIIKDVLSHLPDVNFNDGKCDVRGRLWVGSAYRGTGKPNAVLYRIDADLTVTEMQQDLWISNGLGWSPDNKIFYHTNLPNIYQYDFAVDKGAISNRQIFATVPKTKGVPDGLTVDAEGYIWSAHWNGHCVTRYKPNGETDRVIDMPVQRATSCMFGGKNLDTLFVTSASSDFGEDTTLPEPNGSVYAIEELGVKGLVEPGFAG